jgi:tRNA (guanine37-N1)-methyltransferase
MLRPLVDDSVLKRGQENGSIKISTKNIRDFSSDKHNRVDDTMFGGGPGMLLKPEPVAGAIEAAQAELPTAKVIYLSPGGERFTQRKAEELATAGQDLILLSGRYEGVDQRIRATMIDEELSIGDFVLSGGEIAAAAVIDVVARLVPGVVGKIESTTKESFSPDLFRTAEFPQFTRPEVWREMSVPQVLRSGDHKKIEAWQINHLPGLGELERRVIKTRREILPVKTKQAILRAQHESDVEHWLQWFNDEEVTKYTTVIPPVTLEQELAFYDANLEDLSKLPITICDKRTKQPIGTAELKTDPFNEQSGTLGIVIGDKTYWGKGIATEVVRSLLHIGFGELGYERIELDVYEANIAAQKCYEKCGFRLIGDKRKAYKTESGFADGKIYEILKDDFLNKR